MYDKGGICVNPLFMWNKRYPRECYPLLFKSLISEDLLRNHNNSFSAPISVWPHYQPHCNCFLVTHQCKAKEIPAKPASRQSSLHVLSGRTSGDWLYIQFPIIVAKVCDNGQAVSSSLPLGGSYPSPVLCPFDFCQSLVNISVIKPRSVRLFGWFCFHLKDLYKKPNSPLVAADVPVSFLVRCTENPWKLNWRNQSSLEQVPKVS